jgi:hypothetical protein
VSLLNCWFVVWIVQLIIDWKVKGSLMMLIHHIIFPLSYGTGLYLIQPAYGMYVMAVLQVRPPTLAFPFLSCLSQYFHVSCTAL